MDLSISNNPLENKKFLSSEGLIFDLLEYTGASIKIYVQWRGHSLKKTNLNIEVNKHKLLLFRSMDTFRPPKSFSINRTTFYILAWQQSFKLNFKQN